MNTTRRQFLQQTSIPVASTLLNLQLAGNAAAENAGIGNDRKALIAVHLDGGMDGYHLLVPRDTERHAEYASSRSNLHLPLEGALDAYRKAILPLTENDGGSGGELYGLHANCQGLADMFNGTGDFQENRCASFVGNVGSLIKPLNPDQYFSSLSNGLIGVDIPVGIGGHFRQSEQWQTVIPQGTVNLRGWFGRAADLVHGTFNRTEASMNISLAGNNLLQSGVTTRPFAFSGRLSNGLNGSKFDPMTDIKNMFHRRMLGQDYNESLVDKAFAENSIISLEKQVAIRDAVKNFDRSRFIEQFPNDSFSKQFEDALILIASSEELGLCRQTFFIQSNGWDHHAELPNAFADQIASVSEAISLFQRNLNHLGLADQTIGFTTSEFARTLRSTGAGSDHAWGGPQMIFGGPINAGKVLGDYPNLALRSGRDTGRGGRFLPSHSCDEYFVEMLRWFGLTEDQIDVVLPNYDNFRGGDSLGYIS